MTDLHAASFRDPHGFIFTRDGVVFRQVQDCGRAGYDALMTSGLYARLVEEGLLVAHDEVDVPAAAPGASVILRPAQIPFISYPYEWCFSQLKDAALLTLAVQMRALEAGLSLKDASAYNVQFLDGRPVFIDTLSFEPYAEGRPWVAYRQYCQHFLAPLALMSHVDVRLGQLLRVHIDGIPLDLASTLLPRRTRWNLGLLSHLHLHAKYQQQYADRAAAIGRETRMSLVGLRGLLEHLQGCVQALRWEPKGTEWANYYNETNYTDAAFGAKERLVGDFLAVAAPRTAWDLGANTGAFSRIAALQGAQTVAFDIDPAAVEQHYRACRTQGQTRVLPLVSDLTNPSPAQGWAHAERAALLERGPADAVLALALIHHLAIGNNLPLGHIAHFFSRCAPWAVVEFVPKEDSQVQRMLATREDIFTDYTRAGFEAAVAPYFRIERTTEIPESARTLYLLRRKAD